VVRALHRKLLRDLWGTRGQGIAIALVMACATATFVGSTATWKALERSRDLYYARDRFADVFAAARRVPEPVRHAIEAIPGVAETETRVLGSARTEVDGGSARLQLVSLPPDGGGLNRLHVRQGRLPSPGSQDEGVVSENFAVANRMVPGHRLILTINGRRDAITVTGIVLSPEYVYAIPPGGMLPDDRHFGIAWLPRRAMESAFDMEGAFDAVALRLVPGTPVEPVVAALDRILVPYGGLGAHGRDRQLSHRFVSDEIRQQRGMARVIPAIFLGVAAFLVSVTLTRLVAAQRGQVGTLKALGYGNRAIALHYAGYALVVAGAGALAGEGLGHLFGAWMSRMYRDFYRFPVLDYRADPVTMAIALALAVATAAAGAMGAVRSATRLAPAEAMRPPAPASFRRSLLERAGLAPLLSLPARMAARNLGRRPVRALLGTVGIGSAVAVLVTGAFFIDSIDQIVAIAFERALRADATVAFTDPVSRESVRELAALPGVRYVEPSRAAPVVLRHGSRSHRVALTGYPPAPELSRVLDRGGNAIPVPADGLVLSRRLADLLGVRPGTPLRVEFLDGHRRVVETRVAGTVDDLLGLSAIASLEELSRWAGDGDVLSGAHLAVEEGGRPGVERALALRPRVATVTWREDALQGFRRTLAEMVLAYAGILVGFAVAIAGGVVYNAVRVAFGERERELATLRVIGFRRGEAWRVLLGEVAAQVALALPVGAGLGLALAWLSASAFESDLFRIPIVVARSTWVFAFSVTIAAALATSVLAFRWISRQDLATALRSGE
jgi:putative ABC transport system permease protein